MALAALLFLFGQAKAGQRPGASTAGDFDYFLLSLSIAPSFCALSPSNAAKDECRSLTAAAFQQTPLTVHGLWPNRIGVPGFRQPQNCPGPSLGTLPAAVLTDLTRYMPAGPGLERYEWGKHGICSGLAPDAYFTAIAQLAAHANDVIGGVMRERGMLGHQLVIADLLAGVAAKEPALAAALVIDCRTLPGGRAVVVDEIRVVLAKDFTPLPATSVRFQQNSGCPAGRASVPDAPP